MKNCFWAIYKVKSKNKILLSFVAGINMTKPQQSLLSTEFMFPICLTVYKEVNRFETEEREMKNTVDSRPLAFKGLRVL